MAGRRYALSSPAIRQQHQEDQPSLVAQANGTD